MDVRYEQFCATDPIFYDTPSRSCMAEQFVTGRTCPDGWNIRRNDAWTILSPPAADLPAQGWKIHVSTTQDNAAAVLDAVWDYCAPRSISFKFLTDRTVLLLRNAKYAERSGSGKFITIYPAGPGTLERTLRELGAALRGSPGPYVLSDVRWEAGPLHVRYGGFAERSCRSGDGELVPAIADPDGRLVPDLREPRFTLPDWVRIPDFLVPAIEERRTPSGGHEFPFHIERPLHFSNGGGIYLATDTRTGRRVVLREARPFAGLDAAGCDAVQRLLRERDFLEKLAGSGVVPELYEHFTCWEHHFLAEEHIEGETLGRLFVDRFPLTRLDLSDHDVAEYTTWALDVLGKVRRGLRVLHDAGIVFGDLHPHNIMVTPGGDIRFVDLEQASYLADEAPQALGAPGYVPADGRTGADVDRYALACLSLALFLPLTILLPLDPDRAPMLADAIARRFPVPRSLLAEATATLRDRRPRPTGGAARHRVAALAAGMDAGDPDWTAVRDSIRDAILASATPDRADRLFPGDVDQFVHGGAGIAHGAAGVLYALARSGAGRYPEHERWLLTAARGSRAGFYDGLHGIAYVLAELGRLDDALAVLERAMRTPFDELPVTLFGGLAGVGLNLLRFAAITGDASLRERAVEAGSRLVEHAAGRRAAPGTRRPGGLMHGFAGQALLHVRLFEATGERRFLDAAEHALRLDVARCIPTGDGRLLLDEGWRAQPYVGNGSLGVGLVIREFLRHRADDDLDAALARIRRATEPEFVIGAGLFAGRAGLMASAAWLAVPDRAVIERHLRKLSWHVVPYGDNVAFPGDQLRRLSMDFATGSAGVLFALSAVLDPGGPVLPFFTGSEGEGR